MFEMNTILNLANSRQLARRGMKVTYESTLEGMQLFPIGKPIPLFIKGRCEGMATISRVSMDAYGTVIVFTLVPVDDKIARALERVYAMMGMHYGDANASRVDSDTDRTGMSAAARMMMGSDRSAREIARDTQEDYEDDDDDDPPGIWDLMRKANPDDPLFN